MENNTPTAFDHLPAFQALEPEVKQKVLERFDSLPEEAKFQVMQRIKTPPSVQYAEPGLEDATVKDIGTMTLGLGSDDLNKGAEDIAEGLAASGTDPRLASAAGTAFKMIPEAIGLLTGGKAAKGIAKGAEAAAKDAAETGVGRAVRYVGEKEVRGLTEKQASLAIQQAEKRTLAQSMKSEAGKAIGEAEKAMDVGLNKTVSERIQRIVSNKKQLAKFADQASRLADKGADSLAATADKETLQFYRKTAQQGIKSAGESLDQTAKAKLYQINKVFGEALGKDNKEFGNALSRFKEMDQFIKDLPEQFNLEKKQLKLALEKARTRAVKEGHIRKMAGATALAGAAAGGGSYAARKLMGAK